MKKAVFSVLCLAAAFGTVVLGEAFKTPKYMTRYNMMVACDYYLLNQTTPGHFLKKVYENRHDLKRRDILHRLLTDLPNLRNKVEDGSVIYVSSNDFEQYCDELVFKGDKKVIFVVKGAHTFPDDYTCADKIEKILAADNLGHVFVQNNNYRGPSSEKVSHWPVGINHPKQFKFPHSARKFDRKIDQVLANLKPTTERKIRPLCDFQFANSSARHLSKMGEDRAAIARYLHDRDMCDFLDHRVDQLELYRLKGERAFDVSPIGVGFDCYRTWESLMLGCIVIVKSSFLDPMFEGLPVVLVKDWSEITEKNLQKWLIKYGDVFNDPKVREKVSQQYWHNLVLQKQQELKIASNS